LLRAAGYRIDDEAFIQRYLQTMSYMPDACCLSGVRGEKRMRQTLEQSYRAWPMERVNAEMQCWLDKTKKRLIHERSCQLPGTERRGFSENDHDDRT
jgi:hypothetical protein